MEERNKFNFELDSGLPVREFEVSGMKDIAESERPTSTRVILNSSGNKVARKHSFALRHWQTFRLFNKRLLERQLHIMRDNLTEKMLEEIKR
jgi:hypothetical protein